MTDKSFFKPTQLYKEYIILDLIEKNKDITQRELASHLGIAVSMVNLMLDSLEKSHLLKRKKASSKVVDYVLTKQGFERRKVLNIMYLRSSQLLYDYAKENITTFLDQLELQGYKNFFLYGAGEVAEMLLHALYTKQHSLIKILGIIDDDIHKQGKTIYNVSVKSIEALNNFECDGILISSYTNKDIMINNIIQLGYESNKIINFFDISN
jgi:DNA-binding MarR family transcriptional regulator